MSTIKNAAFDTYGLTPLDVDSINIAPLTTQSISSLNVNSIPTITINGTGGSGGTGGTTSAYGMGSANVTWSAGNWGSGTGYVYPNTIGPLSPTITIGTPNVYNTSHPGNVVTIQGDADFKGNVKINGKDLLETLGKIEDRLAILRPNEELEEKWEELRELSRRYKEVEADIIEKEKMWKILEK